ncbi:HAD family hydrolase [Brevibacillus sp. 179-C1.2 HS]|uniref:HAD family hydrolase n=1 Tax=unclassified Brevibacillus TaxID=2684853 RepID=UPI00399FA819
MQMGIVTGKGRKSADISLREWGLDTYFPVVITGDEVTASMAKKKGVSLRRSLDTPFSH